MSNNRFVKEFRYAWANFGYTVNACKTGMKIFVSTVIPEEIIINKSYMYINKSYIYIQFFLPWF